MRSEVKWIAAGAAVLVVAGAVHASAGMVRFVSVAHPAEQVRAAHPEAVVTSISPGDADALLAAGRVQAWVAGPGMGTGDDSAANTADLVDPVHQASTLYCTLIAIASALLVPRNAA